MPYRPPIRFSESVEHRLLSPRDFLLTKRWRCVLFTIKTESDVKSRKIKQCDTLTLSIIKDEFCVRKDALWKKIEFEPSMYRITHLPP